MQREINVRGRRNEKDRGSDGEKGKESVEKVFERKQEKSEI